MSRFAASSRRQRCLSNPADGSSPARAAAAPADGTARIPTDRFAASDASSSTWASGRRRGTESPLRTQGTTQAAITIQGKVPFAGQAARIIARPWAPYDRASWRSSGRCPPSAYTGSGLSATSSENRCHPNGIAVGCDGVRVTGPSTAKSIPKAAARASSSAS